MKQLALSLFVLFIVSCSTTSNKYEKLISDYAQTDKHGTWTDIEFTALEIEELDPIRVSDSLSFLENKFNKEMREKIASLETHLQRAKEGLEKEKKSRIKTQAIIDMFTKQIGETEKELQTASTLQFSSIYDEESPDKVLLIPVKCKYSYVFPPENPKQIRTDIFYFTPDISKIVMQEQTK